MDKSAWLPMPARLRAADCSDEAVGQVGLARPIAIMIHPRRRFDPRISCRCNLSHDHPRSSTASDRESVALARFLLLEEQGRWPRRSGILPSAELLETADRRRKTSAARLNELTAIHGLAGFAAGSVLVVGLGASGKFDAGTAFSAGFALAKRLAAKPRGSMSLAASRGVPARPPVGSRRWLQGLSPGPGDRACGSPSPTGTRSKP